MKTSAEDEVRIVGGPEEDQRMRRVMDVVSEKRRQRIGLDGKS